MSVIVAPHRGRPVKLVAVVQDAGEDIRGLTDELSEMVSGPALDKVHEIDDVLIRVAREIGYNFLDPALEDA